MSKKSLFLPQLPVWLLRIASSRNTLPYLLENPMTFSAWYAAAHEILRWPEEVRKTQAAERAKKMSLERMTKLLSQVNYAFDGKPDAVQARALLEGYAVHEWVSRHTDEFQRIVSDELPSFESLARVLPSMTDADGMSTDKSGLDELFDYLELAGLEREILAFAVAATISRGLQPLLQPFTGERLRAEKLWTTLFATSAQELSRVLRPTSTLRLCGILQTSGARTQLVSISEFWLQKFLSRESLMEALLEPVEPRSSAGAPARMLEEDLALASDIVCNAPGLAGVNLLLYGASSLDKRQLLKSVVERAGRTAWRVRKFDDASRSDRPSLVYVAQRVLAKRHPNAALVVERPADALSSAPPEFLRMFFGVDLDVDEERPFDENLLATNPVPTIWLASNASSLPDETVARFVFHAPLKKADRKDRQAQLEQMLQEYKLTKAAREEVLKLDGVSSEQLRSALMAARLVGARSRKERDAAVVQAVKRSQKALARDVTAKMKPSVTQYSLKYLNTAGRFGPEDILRCLKNNPRGSLVFYGPPGTGKTQFVEYMAAELGMPLVSKKASELLSKWLGESEKNIAAAFEEAANEDAILFLDEGDSFLRDRALARESWQVTQVNEMLRHIERFDGIVVVATNLFRGLDAAALRRFTFKVEFRELDADQRWEMFLVETGLKGHLGTVERSVRDAWWEKLILMKQLTAGDFATVKRQCTMLGVQLKPEEWLEQLQLECDVKKPLNEGPLLA